MGSGGRGRRGGKHTSLLRDLKKIILEKIVGTDKRSKKEHNILKAMRISTRIYSEK